MDWPPIPRDQGPLLAVTRDEGTVFWKKPRLVETDLEMGSNGPKPIGTGHQNKTCICRAFYPILILLLHYFCESTLSYCGLTHVNFTQSAFIFLTRDEEMHLKR